MRDRAISERLRLLYALAAFFSIAGCATCAPALSTEWPDRRHLPIEPYQELGKIAPSVGGSDPIDWPKEIEAPKGAPNVLLVMMDDVGFGASSSFGGPIPTPTLDRVTKKGLRYNAFHTTAVCSPTRAALITGRNHHVASTGIIMEFSTPYPGYHSLVSRSVGTIGEILTANGYGTSWFGKNHNVPDWQTSPAGPFHLWPTGLGFEYFYGFLGADAHQFRSPIYENTVPIEPYLGKKDFHLDEAMADRAIAWMRTQKSVWPNKPFFAYYTPGTAHAPHHAPKEWLNKFKGKFDHGWHRQREMTFAKQKEMGIIPADAVLNPFTNDYQKWDELNTDEKRIAARGMEAYAAALAHADYQVGRVINAIEEMGELENTLVIYIMGDNGSSAEDPTGIGMTSEIATMGNKVADRPEYMLENLDEFGGMWFENHYSHSWAHAMNTPFQWDKKIASHLGGSRTGMALMWGDRIKDPGAVRSQFSHVNDIVPTILEAASLPEPETINGFKQVPMNGKSLLYTLNNPDAPEQHKTQYFEVIANQGVYHDGWIANSTPKRLPWEGRGPSNPDPFNDYEWELYNLREDFSQSKNLAKENPEKLEELRAIFISEAKKNQVFPLDDRYIERADPANRPEPNRGRKEFVYYDGTFRIPEGAAVSVKNTSFKITAKLFIPEGGAEGMIITQGGWFAGWGLMLLEGKPTFKYSLSHYPEHKHTIKGKNVLPAGDHTLVADFDYEGGGVGKGATVTLLLNGEQVAKGNIPATVPTRFSMTEGLDVGRDAGLPLTKDYDVPFRFTGKIGKVVVTLEGEE
ncbi:Arylsulfatase [Synechococcus sp. MIT S9509]|nr:Arylsulfatase [Synechococcus sp. MIT S9509]